MANITTVARPYVKAILSLGARDNSYAAWSNMLEFLSISVQDPAANKILTNLAIPSVAKADFLCDVGATVLTQEAKNLIKSLAKVKRLLILPEIYRLYEEIRRKIQNQIIVDLKLAQAVESNELEKIQQLASNSLHGNITLLEQIDDQLIAGATAQIDNRVIDGSLRGRLKALQVYLHK